MARHSSGRPAWYFVALRIALLTFLFTLMALAITLFFSILSVVLVGAVRGSNPNLPLVRVLAPRIAVVAGVVALVAVSLFELRGRRRSNLRL